MRFLSFLVFLTLAVLLAASSLYAEEYLAFSLRVAQDRITSTSRWGDFRKIHPDVLTLASMSRIRGLVYDRENRDIILVGERDSRRATLTLDDLVVALRARFIHGEWPLVSIDPVEGTQRIDTQVVRFAGGIQNTQFGQDILAADCELKQIGMGLMPAGVAGVRTYWDLSTKQRGNRQAREERKVISRFWFYPVTPSVCVKEDVIAIRGLKVGVFTEVLQRSTMKRYARVVHSRECSPEFCLRLITD